MSREYRKRQKQDKAEKKLALLDKYQKGFDIYVDMSSC
jgi:hypothetical protein